jgi:hypothetical protein|tara:strand:+ start:28 stop:765 length:738 start_codon:yes stop_codon:yes gene_type:complete
MSRGYLIYAIDEPYISKANALKKSIEYYTNDSVTILSDKFPDGDATYGKKHKIHNFWQIYWATPYDETIVLDADMLFLNDYSYWWNYLSKFDMLFPDTIINYKQETVSHEQYDRILTDNNIRPSYEKMFYFRKGQVVQELFTIMEQVIKNFEKFSFDYFPDYKPQSCITSYIFPICIKMLGIEDVIYDRNDIFKYVDMKLSCLNTSNIIKWDEDLNYWGDYKEFYIENFKQYYPLHYRNAEIHTL